MQVQNSRYVKLDKTYYYIGKFNMVLSLYRVLRIAFYFSKNFLKFAAIRILVATKVL